MPDRFLDDRLTRVNLIILAVALVGGGAVFWLSLPTVRCRNQTKEFGRRIHECFGTECFGPQLAVATKAVMDLCSDDNKRVVEFGQKTATWLNDAESCKALQERLAEYAEYPERVREIADEIAK